MEEEIKYTHTIDGYFKIIDDTVHFVVDGNTPFTAKKPANIISRHYSVYRMRGLL